MRVETIGNATLYLGDCREILPTLGKVDAVVTDPPYGIGGDQGKQFKAAHPFNGSRPIPSAHYPDNEWDRSRPERATFDLLRQISGSQIIWGGNYFADYLPAQGRWLWWDKEQTMPSFGDGEMAWTNLGQTTPKKFRFSNNRIFAERRERFHPTQKPIEVLCWCLEFIPEARTILDPFMGSGTTGVASVRLGRKFFGIEIESTYFDIACKRIEEATTQPDLFIQKPKATEQLAWDEMWTKPFDRPELVWGNLPAKIETE